MVGRRLALLVVLAVGCHGRHVAESTDAGPAADWRPPPATCPDPTGDADADGISNSEEGCATSRDTDQDAIPDWQDSDSDDDGIPDEIEKGAKDASGNCDHTQSSWPCDTDGDGTPDYLDLNSDGDLLPDEEEDANGDGLLGCCLTMCHSPGAMQVVECVQTADGCGLGQECLAGTCLPAILLECASGETSPTMKDTFGVGRLDGEWDAFICRDATDDNPKGRKPVQLHKSVTGDWHVALAQTTSYGLVAINSAGPKQAAATIDEDAPKAEVAGFVLSRETTEDTIQDELADILQGIGKLPGGSVSQRASGIQIKSHDLYDSVQGTILDLSLSVASDVSTVRNELIAVLLGRPITDLGNLPPPYGSSHTELVVRFVTVKRVELKRDAQGSLITDARGYPVDSGDKTKWRLVIMGAVAARSGYEDPSRTTGLLVDDLSNGTALATASSEVVDECDVLTITSLPLADIIWVVDESSSMDDRRKDVVASANNFFSRALSSGLDFRMGVTGTCDPADTGSCQGLVGKLCSKISNNKDDDGGVDRFLLPSEQMIFSSCVQNPPGYGGAGSYGLVNAKGAVTTHLPRASGDPTKIRPDAKLAIIVVTDKVPQSLSGTLGNSAQTCTLDASTQTSLDQQIQPYLSLFQGVTDPQATAMLHVIGGVCSNSCEAEVAHGYRDLPQQLGGQFGDICQQSLDDTLQVIIDNIVAAASCCVACPMAAVVA